MIKPCTLFLFTLISITSLSQSSINTAGNEASGPGGNSSFSIGQLVYKSIHTNVNSELQGVQQPFEISFPTSLFCELFSLDLNVFPNPTSDFVTVQSNQLDEIEFSLFNSNGKLVKRGKLNNTNYQISFMELVSATYILSVYRKTELVKSLTIIKN